MTQENWTPKEQALHIYNDHLKHTDGINREYHAKKASEFTVKLIIDVLGKPELFLHNILDQDAHSDYLNEVDYWNEVKEEINKL